METHNSVTPVTSFPVPEGSLQVVDADDLVDPADEGRNLDVNPGHVFPAAAETPRDQSGELVVSGIFANQGATSVALKRSNNVVLVQWLVL